MLNWLDQIPYPALVLVALVLLLAPFHPMPHIVEKLLLLKAGNLNRPLDIFDLIYHLIPSVLLMIKIVRK